MSPIVIDVPTEVSLAVQTKGLLLVWLTYLSMDSKNNVCKQLSSLHVHVNIYGHCIITLCNGTLNTV